ncbi:Acyl-CoA dehydrogenase (plasmid) [Variovorax sp. SRS16]|uniref:acyl-CoA dehydrogenase family protein n=1 Tax=Variovorax sp. SRS16 TaxID=282217 RepID=UPI0013164EE1|nr:acyl-CoA dehydrogenase family protein [Variovorax sp. SRS16]VTU45555.1 Acyl-CoA dehydrogenase [Variovorax sp. SRS16]
MKAAAGTGEQGIGAATALVARLREHLAEATHAMARACAPEGRLSSKLLDRVQVPAFELAHAAAELLATRVAFESLHPASSPLDARLALLFAAEAMLSVGGRLDAVFLEFGIDAAPLHALARSAAAIALRRETLGIDALDATGRMVATTQSALGPVPMADDVAMAQEAFRRFAAEVVAPMAEEIHRQDLTVPETLLGPLREMGVFGLAIPQAYGGSAPETGHGNPLMIAVTETLSEASLAAAGSLITRPEILSRALIAGGTPAQKAAWLPRIAAGEPLCAIAITEPDHGSDVAGLSLKASPTDGGWLLDGAKTWCTFAGKAGLIMVVARTDPDRTMGHKGLSVLLVEKPSTEAHAFDIAQEGGGRLRGKAIPTIGYRGMHSFDLSFENFFVPDRCVIGEAQGLGQGFYFTMAGMTGGRMQTAARATGVMRAALDAAVRYAGDRKVFGAPLIDCPLTSSKIARMAARFAACRQLTYAVGAMLDQGRGRMEASLVKLFACRSAELVTREALQIHGGMGYAEETPVSRYFVDARVLSIFEGAEETLALKVVARTLLEEALT